MSFPTTEHAIWIDPDGQQHSLTEGQNILVELGAAGWGLPPVELLSEIVPLQPGAIHRGVRYLTREFTLPVVVYAPDRTQLWALLRPFLLLFDPTRGPGKIMVINPGGGFRQLHCRYRSGLEGRQGRDISGVEWQRFLLVFQANDPFWYGVDPIQYIFNAATPVNFFPLPPVVLTSSTIFANGTTLFNGGDVETWPIWQINGPGVNPTFENLTTGEFFTLTTTLAGGENIIIDTRPGAKTVKHSNGNSVFSGLSLSSKLWALIRGENQVKIVVSSTGAGSSVTVSYFERFLTV